MKCLIIAAGQGKRLSNKGNSKPLIPLLGVPLIERVILTAKKSGLDEFYVVTGYNGKKLRQHLDELRHNRGINITYITNDEWKKENGISVLKAKEFLSNDNFILMMGDHIFDGAVLEKLKDVKIPDGEVMLVVDKNVESNEFIDIDDVTKVLVRDNRILDIGKRIERYNAYDTGIFLCTPVIFDAIQESRNRGNDSLSGGMKILAENGKAKTFEFPHNSYWIDVDDEKAFKKAEKKLMSDLSKVSDGPISRHLNRRVSIKITKYLVRTNITPNLVSIVSFLLSVLGAFFFTFGGYMNLIIGGSLVQLSSIIDGCDGEIARLKFLASEFGGWFDAVLDRYADAFILFGLTYYVYSFGKYTPILSLFVGFLAIIGTFMNSYMADKYDSFMKKSLIPGKHYLRIGRDVRMFIIFIGCLINQPFLTLVLLAALMNAENIRRIIVLYNNKGSYFDI